MNDFEKDYPIVTEDDLSVFTEELADDCEERFYTLNGKEITDEFTE